MQPLLVGKIAVLAVSPSHTHLEYGGAVFCASPAANFAKSERTCSQMQFALPAGSLELSAALPR